MSYILYIIVAMFWAVVNLEQEVTLQPEMGIKEKRINLMLNFIFMPIAVLLVFIGILWHGEI
jgi:hypothetical protein